MINTSYSYMTTEELLNYAQTASGRTDLEIELAQRLDLALAMFYEDLEDDDSGRTSQERHQEVP